MRPIADHRNFPSDFRLLRHYRQLLALGSNPRKTPPHHRWNPLRRHRLCPPGRLQERRWEIHWSVHDRMHEFGGHPLPSLSNVSKVYPVVVTPETPANTDMRFRFPTQCYCQRSHSVSYRNRRNHSPRELCWGGCSLPVQSQGRVSFMTDQAKPCTPMKADS